MLGCFEFFTKIEFWKGSICGIDGNLLIYIQNNNKNNVGSCHNTKRYVSNLILQFLDYFWHLLYCTANCWFTRLLVKSCLWRSSTFSRGYPLELVFTQISKNINHQHQTCFHQDQFLGSRSQLGTVSMHTPIIIPSRSRRGLSCWETL